MVSISFFHFCQVFFPLPSLLASLYFFHLFLFICYNKTSIFNEINSEEYYEFTRDFC